MIFRNLLWRFIPALLLGLILLLLYKSLTISKPANPDVERPFPDFSLAELHAPQQTLTLNSLKGDIRIVHVWATWCGVCIREHHEWVKIKEKWPYDLIGIVYRDESNKVKKMLQIQGDPYHYVLDDVSGSLGLSLGLRGTPETFVVDKQGVIRYHQLGPISLSKFEENFVPILEKIRQENA